MYAVATILELLNEPAFALAKQQMLDGTRAWAEFRASTLRCLVTCSIAIWASSTRRHLGVFPFAAGQLSYALILNVIYIWNLRPLCSQNGVTLFPKNISSNSDYILSRFSRPLLMIAATFYGQAIFNQILTSGDSYLIAVLAPLPAQGAYALAANYGGLLARMLFQPIEEASRSLFGRLPSPQAKSKDNYPMNAALSHLTTILHFYAILSLLAISLGPPLSPLLLRTLAGARWSSTEAPYVLSAYCYLIPLLAVNGILEAFVSAVATPAQIRAQSFWKVGQLVVFAASSWLTLGFWGLGAQGLVVANAVTMAMRVGWSWGFVRGYLENVGANDGLRLGEMVPAGGSLAVTLSARWVLGKLLSESSDVDLGTLTQSAAVIGLCGLGTLVCERKFLISMIPDAAVDRFPILRTVTGSRDEGESKKDR
ncbi:oligosaccharide translocation protein RFT1, partial [Lecanoromycetidae sp. Uapishka_2]